MTQFFARLVERSLSHAPSLRPRLPGRFEAPAAITDEPVDAHVPYAVPPRATERKNTATADEPRTPRERTDTRAAQPPHALGERSESTRVPHRGLLAAESAPALSSQILAQLAPVLVPRERADANDAASPAAGSGHIRPPVAGPAQDAAARAVVDAAAASPPAALAPSRQKRAQVPRSTREQRLEDRTSPAAAQPSAVRPRDAQPTPSKRAEGSAQDATPATIHITIGRVDVRAVSEPASPPPRPEPKRGRAPLDLDEYLRQRRRGER